MNKKTLRQDNAGMSLLELVVAVSIFMVLALLLFRICQFFPVKQKVGHLSFGNDNSTKYHGGD